MVDIKQLALLLNSDKQDDVNFGKVLFYQHALKDTPTKKLLVEELINSEKWKYEMRRVSKKTVNLLRVPLKKDDPYTKYKKQIGEYVPVVCTLRGIITLDEMAEIKAKTDVVEQERLEAEKREKERQEELAKTNDERLKKVFKNLKRRLKNAVKKQEAKKKK